MAYSDADRLLTVRGTLTYPDTETQALTSAHISSFLVNEDAGRDVPVGAAPAASFELKLDNSSGQWEPGGSILGAHILDGAKVEIEIGLWNGATYDYSDIGTYYIDDVQGQEHETLIRLKGSDAMVSLMSEYYADGAGDYPQTLGSLLTNVASVAGVTLESAVFTNSAVSIPAQPAWKNNLTCREAVGYIAACAGGIARFNRAGKLEIVTLKKVSSRAVSTSVYKTIQKGDTSFGGLNAINVYAYGAPDGTSPVRYATAPATPDTSLNSINIRDNPILAHGSTALAALGAGMLSALTGLAFRGATFEWHGDPAVELGELCTVTDLSSTAIPILITKQTLRFASGFSMNSGCAVTTSTKADASGKLQKIFTPTGNLNAEALAGNIYVKAGEKMTLESGGIMNVLSGGEMNIASGGKLTLASGNDVDIGADTLADLLAAATSQTTIWYQTSQPTATATGDIWYDTDASPVTIKRWNGSSWVDITTTALSQALTAASDAQATADGKIKAWAQTTAPSATAVGDLWIDTDDNNKLYRATAAGTGNWVLYKVAAGYVSTSHITIDNDSIDIVSGGNLNLLAGGNLNIKNLGNTANVINMDSTGMTLSSTGQLKLQSTDSIIIGGSPFSVGGTNLYANSAGPFSTNRFMRFATWDIFAGLPDDTPVTISFDIKAQYAREITIYPYQSSGLSIKTTNNIIPSTSVFTRQTITTAVKNWGDRGPSYSRGEIALYDNVGDNNYTVKNLKIEKGTMATDWSPSPSDPASGVKTSKIEIGSDFIDIESGGTLTLNAADDIKIGSGGGTLASTIDLSANDSIKLTVKSLGEGGTNLIPNSDFQAGTGAAAWAGWTNYSGAALDSTLNYRIDGIKQSGYIKCPAGDDLAGVYIDIPYSAPADQPMTLSFFAYLYSAAINLHGAEKTWGLIRQLDASMVILADTYYHLSDFSGTSGWQRMTKTFSVLKNCKNLRIYFWVQSDGISMNEARVTNFQLERGTVATAWKPSPSDPASGVKTSYIDIATDHIDISSGGNLSITSPNTLKITSGTTNATALAIRNDTDYFISAGHLTQSSAPFWVKKDGSIKATSGTIGGFTIGTNSLSAQATGKPLLKLDAANSEIILGGLELFYSGSSGYEFNVGTDELRITASYFGVVGANVFFDVMDGYAWCNGNMSAASFTDRTPAYTGKNAVAELKLVRNDKNGNIDHSTLPAFARKKITLKDKKSKESEADGRDLGAMISILTKAVQELDERLEKIEDRIK